MNIQTNTPATALRQRMIEDMAARNLGPHSQRNRFIAEHNQTEAKPFTWRADPDKIIAARKRGFQMLDSIHLCPAMRA